MSGPRQGERDAGGDRGDGRGRDDRGHPGPRHRGRWGGRDRIEIRGLRVTGVHGVLPEERDRAQPFSLDLDVMVETALASVSDDLADTVDYGQLVAVAAAVVGERSFALVEALAGAVAGALLGVDQRIRAVAVTVHKLHPPVPFDVASAGVRVLRRRPMNRAFLGLGSNLGDRWTLLGAAVADLAAAGDLVGVSPVYETNPVGGPPDQRSYLNLVVELETNDDARALLDRCHRLEALAGRDRSDQAVRFGPRTLDVDVLLVQQLGRAPTGARGDGSGGDPDRVDEPDLQVPHPRMWERRFVLAPLSDLAPDLVSQQDVDRAGGEVRRLGNLEGS